jgi:predicted DNA-binding protein with PD1-like motif
MQVRDCGPGYLVRLEIGEAIIASLTDFVRRKHIKSGWLLGLGAVDNAVLGVYDLKRRVYDKRTFKPIHELINLTGDISWLGKDPVLHVHAVIADHALKTSGGHLFEARCAITVEVMLTPWTKKAARKPDAATGLNLLALED